MIDRLSELDELLQNRDGECPFASISKSPSDQTTFSYIELIHQIQFGKSSSSAHRTNGNNRTHYPSSHDKISKEMLSESIQQLLQQVLLASKQTSPIVAIAGVLNAGKSSLVASFLSPEGRKRLLIGSANKQGTHRFVLWLPESWKESASLWENTLLQIESVFGFPAEELSSDRLIANEQYNGQYSEPFRTKYPAFRETPALLVPLIATDIALDTYGIGLMDCPDIQTGFLTDSENVHHASKVSPAIRTDTLQAMFADQRRIALTSALHISSAFIVVTPANSIQDQTVNDILAVASSAMPGLKTMLAVNRVPRRYMPSEIAEEIRHGYSDRELWRVYMAYHFDGPLQRERLPQLPQETLLCEEAQRSLPIFFRIDEVNEKQTIPVEHFLVSIGKQLSPSRLTQERLGTMKTNLRSKIDEGLRLVHDHNQNCLVRRERWHKALAQAIYKMSMQDKSKASESGVLRLQVSRELIQQVSKSLEKTAPWWAMPGRLAIRWSTQVQQVASNATSWFQVPAWITKKTSGLTSFVTSRWRTGDGGRIISPHDFFETILIHDLSNRLISNQSIENRKDWEDRFQRALTRFQTESRIRLSDQQLDEYTAEMWRRMNWSQRLWTGIAPAGMVFAPIIAVLMLPLDFGGTTVLLAATGKELLLAGMTAVGVSMLNTDTMPKLAENETAWNQLSELFAILCDELGLERPSIDQLPVLNAKPSDRALLPANLPVLRNTVLDHADTFYSVDPSAEKRIKDLVKDI